MYFWHIDDLIQDLNNNIVSEHEKKQYFIALLFLTMHFGLRICGITIAFTVHDSLNQFLFFFLHSLILVWGVSYCYRINKKIWRE